MAAAAAAAATTRPMPAKSLLHSRNPLPPLSPTLRFPNLPRPTLRSPSQNAPKPLLLRSSPAAAFSDSTSPTAFHGPCYVLGDNIDTDQIIPAEYLTLVPSNPDEYQKLGTYAFAGLPSALYSTPFFEPGAARTRYPVVIAGANFGCGSSREHAPVALGAAGVAAVIAESYARIFFRNSVATGEVYPLELEAAGLHRECTTGNIVTVDLEGSILINHTTSKQYRLKPIGDAGPVIEAGGIFAYARKMGMISSPSTA